MATETSTKATVIEATLANDVEENSIDNNVNNSTTQIVFINDKKKDLSTLTVLDKERYAELAKPLNSNDLNSIANFGCELQNTLGKCTANVLNSTRMSKAGELGELIPSLLSELDEVNVDDLKVSSPFTRKLRNTARHIPVIRHFVKGVEKMAYKYKTIDSNVEDIKMRIQATRMSALQDNTTLETVLQENVQYKNQIEDLIIAGKLKIQELDNEIADMVAHSDEYDTYEIADKQDYRDNLDKRIIDLMGMHALITQSIPQIRMIQKNNIIMANKAQTIVTTTIPLWRYQLGMAVAIKKQSEGLKAIEKATRFTSELNEKSSLMLKENTIAAAKANEESVITLESLQKSQENLINAIKEAREINISGAEKRKELERGLQHMNNELEVQLTQARSLGTNIGNAMRLLN